MHKLAEFLTSDSLSAQGYFEFEGFTGHLPMKREREFQAWVQISVGLQLRVLVLHRALHARARGVAAGGGARRRGASGSPPTACARSRCSGQNVCSYGRDLPEGGEDHASPSFCR